VRGVGGESPEGEYERHRGAVLGMLAKRFPRLDDDELLAIYHDAWARVLAKRGRGERIESLRAYLMAAAGAEAMNLVSRVRPPLPVGPDDRALTGLADDTVDVEEQVVVRDQARIARDLLDTLDERQRDVLKLRWDVGLSGPEVRAALGLSRRQYQRLTEEGITAVAERVEQLEDGSWSRRQRSLITACLVEVTRGGKHRVGIASERQRVEVQRRLESDPHVAALYREISGALRRASALLPLPAFVPEVDTSPLDRLAELASQARSNASDLLESARHQATSIYVRAADPTVFSSPRPSTAVAAVAGSLAMGGGAYGAYEAVSTPPSAANPPPPTPITQPLATDTPRLAPTAQPSQPKPSKPKPKSKSKSKPVTQPPSKDPTPMSRPQTPAPAPVPSHPTPSPPPSTATEFGFED
jgi:DNA-directed RNA polymerase specialized sigma24 family protein